MGAEADALGATEGARLDDEDLLAGGLHSNAETGEFVVPKDGVRAVDRETVHGALGEGAELAFGYGAAILRSASALPGSGELFRKRAGSAVTVNVDVGSENLIAGLAR